MKIAMYWHNGRSLGHTAEVAKISKGLVNAISSISVLGVTGAHNGLDMLPKEMEIVKLPGFENFDTDMGLLFTNKLGFEREKLFNLRSQILSLTLHEYQPEYLLVNHEPYGLDYEMRDSLTMLKNTKRILTLRGIIYGAEDTNRDYFSTQTAKWIEEHFDSIFIHIDPNIFSLEDYYKIPPSIVSKMHYVGYLEKPYYMSKKEARRKLNLNESDKVIVASMGGGQGAYKIWIEIIKALKSNVNFFSKVICITGPYLEESAYTMLSKELYLGMDILFIRYTSDMKIWMKASDLFIGAGGANMLSEILAVGCNSIVIPRQISESEQLIHSSILSQKGYIRMCTLSDVYSGGLIEKIIIALQQPIFRNACEVLMNGAENYYKLLEV